MKIKKDEVLTRIAVDSKCVICGKLIGYAKLWQCVKKDNKYFFAHEDCLWLGRRKK